MLELACTAIEPGAAADDGCDGAVDAADRLVGNASAFVTGDGRAVVTVVFTAPPGRAVGTARDVAALVQVLSATVAG